MQTNFVHQTPHLTTATTEPLNLLEQKFINNEKEIENWFSKQWNLSPAPVYGSVDLRNAGFKLAPVDMNLFPAGFNNLNKEFLPLSVDAARAAIQQFLPSAQKILLIPENHTRNPFYWVNIQTLLDILTKAGFETHVGSLLENATDVVLPNGKNIPLATLQRSGDQLTLKNFIPDVILLNNDLSDGIPDILQYLRQPIIPPAELGWHQRLKSGHFQYYADVAQEFSKLIHIDPWFIAPLFRHCGEVDFMHRDGEDCLTKNVGQLLQDIQKKYDEYQIPNKPFVIVKADA
ncbi:MAG TPA: glutamate--cysteine ligase, partial [Gammaproteobacteria bacterium]|nr:glutamate--cysteine ligase [Gammaproteobacteria bacterium]